MGNFVLVWITKPPGIYKTQSRITLIVFTLNVGQLAPCFFHLAHSIAVCKFQGTLHLSSL